MPKDWRNCLTDLLRQVYRLLHYRNSHLFFSTRIANRSTNRLIEFSF